MLRTLWPARMSHTCTVLSHPPLTSRFSSSGTNLSENTRLLCPDVTLGMLQGMRRCYGQTAHGNARPHTRQRTATHTHGNTHTATHTATHKKVGEPAAYPPDILVTKLFVASSYTRTDRSFPAVANSAPSGR